MIGLTEDWRKSSRSAGNCACVEARLNGRHVEVRDSKQHGRGPVLQFDAAAWTAFIAEVRNGH